MKLPYENYLSGPTAATMPADFERLVALMWKNYKTAVYYFYTSVFGQKQTQDNM